MTRARPAEFAGRLGLLAATVVGRHVDVCLDPHTNCLAWSDGWNIHLGVDADEQQARLAVLVQAALIRAGSLVTPVGLRLVGRPALARRYLALEGRRAVILAADRLPLRLLHHPALAPAMAPSASAAASLARAGTREYIPEPDALLGVLRPGSIVRASAMLVSGAAGSKPGSLKMRKETTLDDESATQESKILKRLSRVTIFANPLADMINAIIGAGTQPSGDAASPEGVGEDISGGAVGHRARTTTLISHARRPVAGPAVVAAPPGGGYRYAEWDSRKRQYRDGYTRVHDFIPWDDAERLHLDDTLALPSRALTRQLARLALGLEPHGRQQAGEEIVTDDLVRLVADLRAGHGGDARIYRAMQRTRRDLGVLILIDASASVRDLAPDGRSLQHHQVALGWSLARSLEAVGDRVALYGFNSWGREQVHLMRVKAFDDRIDGRAVERVGRLTPMGFTRIGAAVRHGGAMVEQNSGTSCKLVVLITDGLSYDEGYETEYAESDTRRAIAELRARRIGCLCLSAGGDADAKRLKRVFGHAAFMRADSSGAVSSGIGRLFAEVVVAIANVPPMRRDARAHVR